MEKSKGNLKKTVLGNGPEGVLGISVKTLQRHFACFGSSGSGKTVASKVMIEELAKAGIPIIAFDPQGDIASLALSASVDELKKNGVDTDIQQTFQENVEVVIWTPGSSKGIPICINPLQFDEVSDMDDEDKTRYYAATAKNIASLVGYDLESDDGKSAEAVMSVIFEYCNDHKKVLDDFSDLVALVDELPDKVATIVSSVGTRSFLKKLSKKLSLLTLGSRKLIFQTGVPANIDALLGLDGSTDKTRISIIYLNTLHSSEEKEFFISGICQLLYRWMLRNPLKNGQEGVQCAMFIDEIAPYIPPVKVPSCKESLELLFRQGRKYGVSSLIATQSPGDIDYKAIGQFSTFTLGTLNTKQDIEKVKKRLESIAPKEIDYIVNKLPALKPGNFLLISPDEYDKVQTLNVRWLVTQHVVISEHQISDLVPNNLKNYYLNQENSQIDGEESENDVPEVEPLQNDIHDQEEADDEISSVSDSVENIDTYEEKKIKTDNADKNTSISVVKSNIYERDVSDKVKRYMGGTIFKSEKLETSSFTYLPLIMVELVFLDVKGIFKKTVTEIPEKLYLDYDNMDIMFVDNKHFMFESVIDSDPHKIEDIDNYCIVEKFTKDEIDFDFRGLGGKKVNKKKVKSSLERKYRVNVRDSELILFPIWQCTLRNKKTNKKRELILDSVFGNEMTL